MRLFKDMSKEEAKDLYDMVCKETAETVVNIIKQDLEFFTEHFTKDYLPVPKNEFMTDLIIEQNEQA